MTRKPNQTKGFLARLIGNQAGNVLAMTAAMLIPLMGLVGGGIDMSRLYLVKTRLQQACDAGALAGRRAMGSGTWTTTSGGTADRALNTFRANFKSGDYGATGITDPNNVPAITSFPQFTQSNGTVTGRAVVNVPMMVVKVLGITSKNVRVDCTATMEIPNTDVMFVLDTTGSMADCPDGSTCNGNSSSKIAGLRSAVQCFYEALTKVNTPEPCTYHQSTGLWDSASDPTATTYGGTAQIRFGFVPYAVNVNVGRLLPNSYFPDSWNYQSRVATTASVWTWTAGTQSSTTWGNWPSNPSNLTVDTTYSGWGNVSSSGGSTMTINGISRAKTAAPTTTSACNALNTMGTNMLDYTYTTNIQSSSLSNTEAPTYPATTQTLTYSQNDNRTAVGYRYKLNNSNQCKLQNSNNRNYTVTRTGTATKPLTWTQTQQITGWSYQQVNNMDISGLKAGGSNWNNSVNLPVGQTSISVNLEGATGSSNINIPSNTAASWSGCVEERATIKNSNSSNAASDWNPIPATALDMDIDTIPSAASGTQWGPMLSNTVYRRYSGGVLADSQTATTTGSLTNPSCPVQARTLQTWTTPTPFVNYVNSLTPSGYTFHDIGMIWGARLLSPTGIFASQNAVGAAAAGQPIQRHIVFMTDGDTNACSTEYSSHGIDGIDRRQTTYLPVDRQLPNSTNQCDDSDQSRIINARLAAICTAIKNRNTTLWVIAFGTDVQSASKTRLQTCASTPNGVGVANTHYFEAANTASLIDAFNKIAAAIADLRLTS